MEMTMNESRGINLGDKGGGAEFTVTTPQCIDRVKAELRGKVLSGDYTHRYLIYTR
jgi:hypothetical protein